VSLIPVEPSLEAFTAFSRQGNVVPVFTQLAADFETPLSAYLKVRDAKNSFLLESAEATDKGGRWSIIGSGPKRIFSATGKEITITEGNKTRTLTAPDDVLAALEREMAPFKPVANPALPPFSGGMVGYLSYDAVRQFEPTLGDSPPDTLGIPDALFMLADTLIVFDHRLRRVQIIANSFLEEHSSPEDAYAAATGRIHSLVEILNRPLHIPALNGLVQITEEPAESNTTQAEYEQMVRDGKEFIKAGDIFQFVPSQRFTVPFDQSPVDLYRALRHVNPSPYMFVLEMGDFALVGSSPEVHVRATNGHVEIRPIAGTKRRGATPAEDDANAAELLADPKERAEHLMLVDLARNDLGRVCVPGTVTVPDYAIIERYSHVMHIVSQVEGTLAADKDAFDLFRATFPAGTLSGAPKVRAMQVIAELEGERRGIYGGAVGYFGFDGGHDSCIVIRTAALGAGVASIQAGAGIVADSVPTSEYEETVNKSKGVLRALGLAAGLRS
jgi:anthranilate synthase component 1